MGKCNTKVEEWTVFGERLNAELKRQNMSYREFAKKAGITLGTVCRYAKSERVPRANEILKTSTALGCTCDYLLGLSDDPYKNIEGQVMRMSILIKGMKMPESCEDCRFDTECGFCCAMPDNFCGYTDGFTKPDWCPLVEVHAPHGRLIDADKLMRDISKYHVSDGKFQHWVDVQPTVIEAEEGEDE